jgi:predicted nucleotidyltransferase
MILFAVWFPETSVSPKSEYPESLLRDPEVRRFLDEKWDLIEEHFAPAHFILFGSRINGTPHEWSDIDMIVVSKSFAGTGFIGRAFHFKTLIDPHIATTVLCYTPEEFAGASTGIGVVPDACREGLWLR